jgi:hypothetical protein
MCYALISCNHVVALVERESPLELARIVDRKEHREDIDVPNTQSFGAFEWLPTLYAIYVSPLTLNVIQVNRPTVR